MKNVVAIYTRLSEEDRDKRNSDDDSESIQNQKKLLIQYAVDKEWEIFRIYSDDDYTGSDRNRPEFQRLIKDAENKKFNIILCKTQSRFTREMELVEKYLHYLFPLWGVRFVSVVDNVDTDNKGNKKARQINGLINEWYLEDISENIRSVFDNKRQNGLHIGSYALYGYKKDPEHKGHLIIDIEAAEIVHEIFELYASGFGKMHIARMLNERGIPPPSKYRMLKEENLSGNHVASIWHYSVISNMLTNDMYIGNMVQGRYGSISYKTKKNYPKPQDKWIRVEHTHEPIIENELWDRVQKLIDIKLKPSTETKQIGLFTGKVRCKYCGAIMRSHISNDKRRYLTCSTYYNSKSCRCVTVALTTLEKAVIGRIQEFNKTYYDCEEISKRIEYDEGLKKSLKKHKSEILKLQKQYNYAKTCFCKSYEDKVTGIITEDQFAIISEQFSKDKEKIEKAILLLENEIEKVNSYLKSTETMFQIAERYKNVDKLNRFIVDELIDHINVGGTRYQREIDIYWNM